VALINILEKLENKMPGATILISFIVSSAIWFTIFSIKIEQDAGLGSSIKNLVCQGNTTLFIKIHELIGDPFELIGKR
tara:strand:+ start:2102 stop:2335 length:234 start_codon:yes stop_codon:yes gene_type:complete